MLLQRAHTYQAEPCLIAGDLNTIAPGDQVAIHALPLVLKLLVLAQGGHIFHSAIAALLSNGYTDCYRVMHRQRSGYTLPSDRPNARLDYLFVNRVLAPTLRHCEVITHPEAIRMASDHLPVVATFDIG